MGRAKQPNATTETLNGLMSLIEQGYNKRQIRMTSGCSDTTIEKYTMLYKVYKMNGLNAALSDKHCSKNAAKIFMNRYAPQVYGTDSEDVETATYGDMLVKLLTDINMNLCALREELKNER